MNKNFLIFLKTLWMFSLISACDGDVLLRTTPCEEGMTRRGTDCVRQSFQKSANGDCKDPDLSNIRKGVQITMCDGSIGDGTLVFPSDCTKEGEQNCVNKSKFKAVDLSKLDASKIARGTTISGISGSLRPSKQCRNYSSIATFDSSYPPSSFGGGGSTFSPAAVSTVSDQITFSPSHGLITNSLVRFTSFTTLPSPLVAGTTYYAIYISNTVIQVSSTQNGTPIDITTQGVGTHTAHEVPDGVAQYFDTIDDYDNGASVSPMNNPWSSNDYLCDASNFVNVTSISAPLLPSGLTPSTANQPFNKIWEDQISGLYITNVLYDGIPNNRSWSDAVRTCESLNGATAGDGWRLPAQKELMQLYIHGISKVAAGAIVAGFWSSSAISTSVNQVWLNTLYDASSLSGARNGTGYSVICVR